MECIAIAQPASFRFRETWPLGNDTIMYPPAQIIQGVVDRRWIRTLKASQEVWHDQLSNSSLSYCRYAGIVFLEEKIVSNSLTNWQDMWMKALHPDSIGLYVAHELLCKLNEPETKLWVASFFKHEYIIKTHLIFEP